MLVHAASDGQLKAGNPTTVNTAIIVTGVKFILKNDSLLADRSFVFD